MLLSCPGWWQRTMACRTGFKLECICNNRTGHRGRALSMRQKDILVMLMSVAWLHSVSLLMVTVSQ